MTNEIKTWENVYKVREQHTHEEVDISKLTADDSELTKLCGKIVPWLTALFQSEHLSLLMGTGISFAARDLRDEKSNSEILKAIEFSVFKEQIEKFSEESAEETDRGVANIEDQIRVANELIKGLEVYISTGVYGSKKLEKRLQKFEEELKVGLNSFADSILECEQDIIKSSCESPAEYLMNFLVSFTSRSATRERLNIFTTNYDRIIEYGAELAGIRLIDRFVGTINPIFRSSRVDVDMHYNPPGIRGEPRYLEGVAQFTKLHGSLDWVMRNNVVRRISLPYGAESIKNYSDKTDALMIYPNTTKDRETSEYPYVELFRDFAAKICQPNSTLVIYGYSFGDQHINRVIEDMLTIPSAHLVIISYSDKGDRIQRFYKKIGRPTQISLMIGEHLGDLKKLVDHYLPKPAIDRTTIKMADILKARDLPNPENENKTED